MTRRMMKEPSPVPVGAPCLWQMMVLPVFVAVRFPTVLPVATFCEVKKH